MLRTTVFIIALFAASLAGALVPIEGILLGKSDPKLTSDPLDYMFRPSDQSDETTVQRKRELFEWIGAYREGASLLGQCQASPRPLYKNGWDHEQARRMMLATLQFIGLDLTVRAMAQYAKDLEFTDEEYQNLSKRLVGNYCSKNLTSMSLRQLSLNLFSKFKSDKPFVLPDVQKNMFYPSKLSTWTNLREAKEKEFVVTVELFKSFCSWGNDVDDLRLLVPIVQDPFIMAFIIRQMSGLHFEWNHVDNSLTLVPDPATIRVGCANHICRRKSETEFLKLMPRAVGGDRLSTELGNMYCHSFRDADYRTKEAPPTIRTIINARSLDEEKFLRSQFFSLITGVPDFLLDATDFTDGKDVFRASVDDTWTNWSKTVNQRYSKDLLYEESLQVEKVDEAEYQPKYKAIFRILFQVNLGELDRTTRVQDKLSALFNLSFPKVYLAWIRKEWAGAQQDSAKTEQLIQRMKINVDEQLAKEKDKFIIPPWEGDLGRIISVSIFNQLLNYEGLFFEGRIAPDEKVEIPVEFRYGMFALKYIHYRFQMKRNEL